MAAKKKGRKQSFSATKAVKSAARAAIGSPPPERVIPDKTDPKSKKHKPTLNEIIAELTD